MSVNFAYNFKTKNYNDFICNLAKLSKTYHYEYDIVRTEKKNETNNVYVKFFETKQSSIINDQLGCLLQDLTALDIS
ncbi:hypothetical protein [Acanthamoeba castellanii mimivirus]|uniref:Uncharacterized protein n=3 Tax=Mimivirus TaxID=315393 RepID=E3VYB7_MIMIV|nr:hypothetical protein MIMI_gp0936 [Acanthamoeba polyphaga mimivirus]AHA44951.1 hypothetical protein HIRU_S45 [Hirudovirus strain Sangsue]AMK62081.1 hypothetical protein [Samba virus]BAV62011.1 hypothetical protein [Acanthamoeba castellanii mimivirus]ADO18439.1 hypothetical protein [Acanthamoeba polyphaga mimivirus]BAV62997.1 hypothetical protein [Acanthamoeba castellanii mimivirus]